MSRKKWETRKTKTDDGEEMVDTKHRMYPTTEINEHENSPTGMRCNN